MSINKKLLTSIGKKVRQLRLANDMTQLELSIASKMEKTAISRIENGRVNITANTAYNIANALEVEIHEIFDFN